MTGKSTYYLSTVILSDSEESFFTKYVILSAAVGVVEESFLQIVTLSIVLIVLLPKEPKVASGCPYLPASSLLFFPRGKQTPFPDKVFFRFFVIPFLRMTGKSTYYLSTVILSDSEESFFTKYVILSDSEESFCRCHSGYSRSIFYPDLLFLIFCHSLIAKTPSIII